MQEFNCELGGSLPKIDLAYETWGKLNKDKSNAILLHTGLSASSHVKSHPQNTVNFISFLFFFFFLRKQS